MHALITGMNGTVAPALAAVLARNNFTITPWDRARMPTDSESAVRATIESTSPDLICHIATGDPKWAQWIAQVCAERKIPLLWTGTVSVFSESARAPLTIDTLPDATDDYGRYKIECERLIRAANPNAIIARLGWQIGDSAGSNNMVDFLTREAEKSGGVINASRNWIPSCAHLIDTSEALWSLMNSRKSGLFQLEGNASGLSFFDIASALARPAERGWKVSPTDAPVRDNRMRDDRIRVGQLADRLRSQNWLTPANSPPKMNPAAAPARPQLRNP